MAPPDASGGIVLVALVLAEWAIFIGPAALVLLWVLGDTGDRHAAVGACLSALLGLAFASALSALYFHPRPFMDGLARNYLRHVPDGSFPSDHATVLFALAWSFLLVRPAWLRAPHLGFALLALACTVGWSRMYLGAHYPLDVVGGAFVGLLSALLVASRVGLALRDFLTDLGEKLYALPFDIFGFRRH